MIAGLTCEVVGDIVHDPMSPQQISHEIPGHEACERSRVLWETTTTLMWRNPDVRGWHRCLPSIGGVVVSCLKLLGGGVVLMMIVKKKIEKKRKKKTEAPEIIRIIQSDLSESMGKSFILPRTQETHPTY